MVGISASDSDPCHWYKDAIIYELPVRSFYDSNADGIGDFPGLIEKLDYLQDIGVTALWLLPFYPSPLKDEGYDIADYTGVHQNYGTLGDFQRFLQEAHRRGLRVITELVLNHTSDQHVWFQRARRAHRGSPARDFYVWSDTTERYEGARIIFKDFESSNWAWDLVAGQHYWHRFYAHQPDLNYDNPQVQQAIFQVVDYWLGLGVDGLRLDAVPYLYEREGTTCENLPETHAFLKALRQHVDERFPNRMLLAEANQWPEDARAYFGDGDECHMAFHFPLMPRLFMALHSEDRLPIIDIQAQTPTIPESSQWALFLRNHDELTLEMVTEEERLYMYRTYAEATEARINLGIRRRLAPLINNERRRMELLNALLFTMPGTPVIYYGDEIGMGDNVYLGDRHGVRTPMQWNGDRNAGFSRAHPQQLHLPLIVDPEYHHATLHVEAQQANRSSLLGFMKRLIALRKRHKAFGRGTLEFLHPDNHRVLTFVRRYEDDCMLVVANLSRFAQSVDLDLSAFDGKVPVELFGRTPFWPIEKRPYPFMLGPHTFHLFALEPRHAIPISHPETAATDEIPTITSRSTWEEVLHGEARAGLEHVLPGYLRRQRWFGRQSRRLLSAHVVDAIAVPYQKTRAYLVFVRVEYVDGDPDMFAFPLAFGSVDDVTRLCQEKPQAVIARVRQRGGDHQLEGLLFDAVWAPGFAQALVGVIGGRARGRVPDTTVMRTSALSRIMGGRKSLPNPSVAYAEHSNTTLLFGDRGVLKLYRRVEVGRHPEVEIGAFLTRCRFPHAPPLAAALEYHGRGEPLVLATFHGFIPNQGDGWSFTLEALREFRQRVQAARVNPSRARLPDGRISDLQHPEIPREAQELIGSYLTVARRLAQRTAEFHKTMATALTDPALAPESFDFFYQRSRYQSMRGLHAVVARTLRRQRDDLPEPARRLAQRVLEEESSILRAFGVLLERPITALRIRCHGNYHLEQVLYTGDDFAIIDFEGETARSLAERRLKRTPLLDVAGMLRSFANAAYAAGLAETGTSASLESADLKWWARYWYQWVATAFLQEYTTNVEQASLLPASREERTVLLATSLLERALYEVSYELNNRPEQVEVPLLGLLDLLGVEANA